MAVGQGNVRTDAPPGPKTLAPSVGLQRRVLPRDPLRPPVRRGVNGRGETVQLHRQRRRERATARRPAPLATVVQETGAPSPHGWRERGRTEGRSAAGGKQHEGRPERRKRRRPGRSRTLTPSVRLQRRVLPRDPHEEP